MKKISKSLLAASVATAISMPAMATNGILPLGNGMVAHGFGGAGIANAAETMSSVDNPALMSNATNQWAAGASIFSPRRTATIDISGGSGVFRTADSENDYFLIPQAGYASSINDKMDFGVLAYALGGMNTEYDFGSGATAGIDLMGLIVAPTFSYKVNDKTSVGASLLIGYAQFEHSGTVISGGFGVADHSDSATGFGLKLGVASEVSPGTTVGFTYQSVIDMDEMDKHCSVNPADPGLFGALKGAGKDCSLDMPDQFGLGVSTQLNSNWKLVADVIQVNWENVDVFKDMFGWENQTIIKIGAETKLSNDMTIRFGFNHGESPIPDEAMDLNWLAPAITEDHLTVGMTKKSAGGGDINAYFAYVLENEQTFPGTPVSAKMDQFAIGVGYNKKF